MKIPDIPLDEGIRLQTLRSLHILDTAPQERFDRMTRMAKRLFDVPISLVSLIDENRQWFKSCMGMDAKESSRDISFCGHAILGDEAFLIPDATLDERFFDNPLVVGEPHIRFYAGYPLKAGNGSKLGTLCIIDTQPRDFHPEDIAMLQDLALMVEHELAAIQIATLDDLTNISNRRGFMLLAQHSLHVSMRQNTPASLVFMDMDKLKKINDTFGHSEGDKALIAFAQQMKIAYRDSDVFARLGGDEFVALLTNTGAAQAEIVVERFAHLLDKYNGEA
ncbi:MAG: sensor domain-containing diguanylate cyclase, partial [Burkholderiales bacterium]|nr:sensor domain-containing diguanylate cyclase [Burkholderiales bacterium]